MLMKNNIEIIIRRLESGSSIFSLCNCKTNRIDTAGKLDHTDLCYQSLFTDAIAVIKNQQGIINRLANNNQYRDSRLNLLQDFLDELEELDKEYNPLV